MAVNIDIHELNTTNSIKNLIKKRDAKSLNVSSLNKTIIEDQSIKIICDNKTKKIIIKSDLWAFIISLSFNAIINELAKNPIIIETEVKI